MRKIVCLFLFAFLFFNADSFSDAEENLRYLSLRNTKVNVRIATSGTSAIKWIYKKKGLPVLIVDEYYNWRKVKDFENDTGWIHISQLSKRRSVLFIEENILVFSKPTIYSRPIFRISKSEVATIKKCYLNWCKVKNNLFFGWVEKKSLWGLNNKEIMN